MEDAYAQSDHAIIYRITYIFHFWWAMRDFIFQTQQPLLTVFRCLFSCIYWLEAPRKCDFGTSNKWLGLLHLSL